MKDELQLKLVEILTSIQTAAGKASDFAMDQLPDIAQSYIAYGRASLTLYVVSCAIALVVIWYNAIKYTKSDDCYDGGAVFYIASLASIIPGGVFIHNLSPMLMVWFAPKVWLLKELASFLK